MLDENVAICQSSRSFITATTILDALIPTTSGDAQPSQGELTAPMQICATSGAGKPPLSSHHVRQERLPVDPDTYERSWAPINWPACLDEDGTTNVDWATEMLKIRRAFWIPLGAELRWTTN